MKSYYIQSINLWIICVNANKFVDMKTKDAIRKQWRQQVHTAEDVVVLDESIAPFEFIGKSGATIDTETVVKAIKQSELKREHLSHRVIERIVAAMSNRYDKIPDYKVIKSAMQQELTDKQIAHVKSEIETAVLQNDDKAYVDLISFNPNQKRKLRQVLKSKGYQLSEESNWSVLINL